MESPGQAKAAGSLDAKAHEENLAVRHTEKEWSDVYPHLERMYLGERRKLRYVMAKMEKDYQFKATLQMYKKRFAKWGFYKNERQARFEAKNSSDTARSSGSSEGPTGHHGPTTGGQTDLLKTPEMSASEFATLKFLTSIRTWSSAFFEQGKPLDYSATETSETSALLPYVPKMTDVYDPEHLSATFRVVSGLLSRGQGVLAGRLARKAFLQVENILKVEGPLFVWNILEILYTMAILGQTSLFSTLLSHLVALAASHYAISHPVVQLTSALQHLVTSWQRDGIPIQVSALEQAWILNASIFFDKFDQRFLFFFYRLVWDAELIKIPDENLEKVNQKFMRLHEELATCGSFFAAAENIYENMEPPTSIREEVSPVDYHRFKLDALRTICGWDNWKSSETRKKIYIFLSWMRTWVLAKASFPSFCDLEDTYRHTTTYRATKISRLDARLLANIVRVAIENDREKDSGPNVPISRMHSIIALREYGQSHANPQVVHELWQLEELLLYKGYLLEAGEVHKEAFRRLEEYLDDVPVYVPIACC